MMFDVRFKKEIYYNRPITKGSSNFEVILFVYFIFLGHFRLSKTVRTSLGNTFTFRQNFIEIGRGDFENYVFYKELNGRFLFCCH